MFTWIYVWVCLRFFVANAICFICSLSSLSGSRCLCDMNVLFVFVAQKIMKFSLIEPSIWQHHSSCDAIYSVNLTNACNDFHLITNLTLRCFDIELLARTHSYKMTHNPFHYGISLLFRYVCCCHRIIFLNLFIWCLPPFMRVSSNKKLCCWYFYIDIAGLIRNFKIIYSIVSFKLGSIKEAKINRMYVICLCGVLKLFTDVSLFAIEKLSPSGIECYMENKHPDSSEES